MILGNKSLRKSYYHPQLINIDKIDTKPSPLLPLRKLTTAHKKHVSWDNGDLDRKRVW